MGKSIKLHPHTRLKRLFKTNGHIFTGYKDIIFFWLMNSNFFRDF